MRRIVWLSAAALLLPSFAFAQGAAFPAQAVWLSDTSPTQGEKVRIYAVIYNASSEKKEGVITFLVDSKINEAKYLALDAGESEIAYSTWTASEGEHSFSARFGKEDAPEAEIVSSISVVAKVSAPPSATEQAITQAKEVGSQIASTSIPIVSAVANKVFETTEAIRSAGLTYLESKQPQAVAQAPAVLGTTTVRAVEGFEKDAAAASTASKGLVSRISQTASIAALAIFRSLWLFYPILVAFLLLIVRMLYRWATRPRF